MPGNSFDKHWHPARNGKPDWQTKFSATVLKANTELFVKLLGVQFYVVEADGRTVRGPLDMGGRPFLRKVAGSALKAPKDDGEPYKDAQGSYKDKDGRTYDFKGLWYLAGKDGKPDWSKPITSDVVVNSNLRVFARVVGATLYVREPPEGGAAVGRDEKVGYAPLARGDELPEPGPAFTAAQDAYNKKTGVASHDNGIPFRFEGRWHLKGADGSIDWKRPYTTRRVWESMSLYTRLFRVTTQIIDEDGRTSTRTVDVPDGTAITRDWEGLKDHGGSYNSSRGTSFDFRDRWHPGKDWGTPLGRVTVDRNTTISTRLFRVHFMVDTGSGKVEVHTAVKVVGEELKSGDGSFRAAEGEFTKRWPGDVLKYADKWYRGNGDKSDFKTGFTSETVMSEVWVWAKLKTAKILFFVDNSKTPVYAVENVLAGTEFTVPEAARAAAARAYCNLNASFGHPSSTGWTGWFADPSLTRSAPARFAVTADEYRLFGRNRLTTRYAYADGSATPVAGADYRTAPRDDAPAQTKPMALPDGSAREDPHYGDAPAAPAGFGSSRAAAGSSVELPLIRDGGPAHRAWYLGEEVKLSPAPPVYRRMGDGRWRTYRCVGWFKDAAATTSGARATPSRDSTLYVKWVELTVDGVVSRSGVAE